MRDYIKLKREHYRKLWETFPDKVRAELFSY